MASVTFDTSGLGNGLTQILEAEDLVPGSEPSYAICKQIYLLHPLGGKLAESPIRIAQSQDREITIAGAEGIEEELVGRFDKTWRELDMSAVLLNVRTQARVYGLSSVGLGEVGKDPNTPLDLDRLWQAKIFMNVFDPLNTPGLIIDQNPNSPTYQKFTDLKVNGQVWHRSRTKTIQNEFSIYLAWTSPSYAYSGRSIYYRILFPLKSYLNTMVVNDMVARKAGLLVSKQAQPGSVVDRIMLAGAAVKRFFLQLGGNNQVLTIGNDETIESLNLQNIDGALSMARNNIIKDIATGTDTPAHLVTQEAYVDGFGEGTEDAKAVAQYIDRLRLEMAPEYAWADEITRRRAWTPDWYETLQKRFPSDFGKVDFKTAYYKWSNAYKATWPNLIRQGPEELAVVDEIKMKSAIAAVQVHAPLLGGAPEQLAELLRWSQAVINVQDNLFGGEKLNLDFDAIAAAYEEQKETQRDAAQAQLEHTENAGVERPFSRNDDAGVAFVKEWQSPRQLRHGMSVQGARSNVGSFVSREIRHAPK